MGKKRDSRFLAALPAPFFLSPCLDPRRRVQAAAARWPRARVSGGREATAVRVRVRAEDGGKEQRRSCWLLQLHCTDGFRFRFATRF